MSQPETFALTLDGAAVERLDALLKTFNAANPTMTATRGEMVRACYERGLLELGRELSVPRRRRKRASKPSEAG